MSVGTVVALCQCGYALLHHGPAQTTFPGLLWRLDQRPLCELMRPEPWWFPDHTMSSTSRRHMCFARQKRSMGAGPLVAESVRVEVSPQEENVQL